MIDHAWGVKLDTIDECHLGLLKDWRNDSRINAWCRQDNLIDNISQRNWWEWQSQDKATRMFLVRDGSNVAVGVCGLTSIKHLERHAEFSLYISPSEQRRGLGRQTLLTLFTYGFTELNLNLIFGESFHTNKANDLFKDIGMLFEGTQRMRYFKDGKYLDANLWSITGEEFLARSYD